MGCPVPRTGSPVPTPAPLVPTIRERLFRPTRWRLWIQFALLGAFVLVVPILFASQRLLDSGREVLIEHEVIDLSDESNLRVNEFREDMAYLARDVKKLVQDNAGQPPQVAEAVLGGLNLPTSGVRADPDSINQARFRYLHRAAVGVFVFRPGDGGVKVSAATAPLPADADRRAALFACLADVGERLARKPTPYNRSALHHQPAGGGQPGRAILAIGEKSGDDVVALVLDFSRYVSNRQRVSPRHFYVVTDPNGRVLIHPDPLVPDARPPIRSLVNWEYPTFRGHDWFETAALSDPDRKKRMAGVVQSGGSRLKAVEAAGLAYIYRKGYLPAGELTDRWTATEAAAVARRLNERMAAELDADPRLRVGELSPTFGYVEVAHPDPARITAVCGVINGWWQQETGEATEKLRWTDPLDCRTFQGQLTPLRVDLNDEDDPAWLVVAASTEELREDIDHRFGRIFVRWVLPTLGIACLVGIVIVLTLSHSVNRLAVAAARLDTDNPQPLPLHGPYEVSKLAHTLDRLVRDVQERDRQLRDRAARYETILRAAGEGVVITDARGVIEEANKAAGRMFGYTPEALIGLPVTTLVQHPDQMPTATDSERTANMVSRTLDTIQGRRRDGTAFWLELNLKPTPLRDRVVVTCIFRDVSLRKEAEERIRRMNDELEVRVRQRTAELEEANTKLEVAVKEAEAAATAKDTFVANMSHELRQPLHIIIGFTEALKEEAADLNADGIVPDLNKILAAAKHLLELINDILDLAKISSGRMELAVAPFPLPKLVDDVRGLVGPLAEKNANTFAVDAPPNLGTMTADERRVRQMLLNLLSNAFKFTAHGSVTLRVRRITELGREWVRFTVSDTGKGMTAEQVKRLFQRFYQADSSTTRGAGGTGLGLAITHSFGELMGGQPIRVTSQEGVGSEFEVTLPAVVERAEGPRLPTASDVLVNPDRKGGGDSEVNPDRQGGGEGTIQPADGRTVLVIDDDPMVRELMERFLAKEGFRVVLAATGEEGLRLAADLRPCVITLDVMMPGADGWAVLGRLKENPVSADIPVVMLTIVDDSGRGFALGAADYLTKPIDWQRLGVILRKYLTPGRGDAVLVIDDDPHSREVVRRHLEREGWGVIEATDGEQGLAAFAAERPGLVLLDLMMPVLDGFGFLDELAKRFPRHRVPVVVLTAKELTPEDFDRLNGRVARILAKGDLSRMDELMTLIRRTARNV